MHPAQELHDLFGADVLPMHLEVKPQPTSLGGYAEPFPFFREGQRSVHRDAHVEVDKAYYSVPPEYVGRRVWVRWDARLVRVFNQRMEQIAVHVRQENGRFSTDPSHIASEKVSDLERGAEGLLKRARLVGVHAGRWAEAMLQRRGIQGVRVLLGLLSLAGRYPGGVIEKACELALTCGAFRLRDLKKLMERPQRQQHLQFMDDHPIIRPVGDYGHIVRVSFRQKKDDGNSEFIALEATSGESKEKSPSSTSGQALPAVQPPASALGSLSSVALSSGPAQQSLPADQPRVNPLEGRRK